MCSLLFLILILKHRMLLLGQCLALHFQLFDYDGISVKVTFLDLILGIMYLQNVAALK